MTESFLSNNDNDQTTNQNLPAGDQTAAGNGGDPDTTSPEYQIQMMQKRITDKDAYIRQLEEEAKAARDRAAEQEKLAQNVDRISEVLNNQGQQQESNDQGTGLDKDALVGEVIENLNRRQAEQQMQENYNHAQERLKQEFGEQHVENKVAEAAQTNGLSVSDLKEMAMKSPQAFYKLVGIEQKAATSPRPTHSSMQAPPESGQRDLAYYTKLMRENPREYWNNPEIQRAYRQEIIKNLEKK